MNEFRMGLLKERAYAIRPQLAEARKTIELAEAEHRDLTDGKKAFTEPIIKTARDVADGMKRVRDEDALMTSIAGEFGDVFGSFAHRGQVAPTFLQGHGRSCRHRDARTRRHQGAGAVWRQRRKYGGDGYGVVFDELDRLTLLDDDGGTGALADWVAEQLASSVKTKARKTSGGAREWEWDPCQPWDGTPPDRRQSVYLHAAVRNEADKVAKVAKTATGGRNDAIFIGALKLGSYVAGAGLDEAVVIAALEAAAETNGYTASDGLFATRASIRSGLRGGRKNPRAVPEPKARESASAEDAFEWFWRGLRPNHLLHAPSDEGGLCDALCPPMPRERQGKQRSGYPGERIA